MEVRLRVRVRVRVEVEVRLRVRVRVRVRVASAIVGCIRRPRTRCSGESLGREGGEGEDGMKARVMARVRASAVLRMRVRGEGERGV